MNILRDLCQETPKNPFSGCTYPWRTSPVANPILPDLRSVSATEEVPRSNHLGAGAALGGSTSCQLLDEGIGGITGSEREIEVYANSLGERFYCNYGTGLKGLRV